MADRHNELGPWGLYDGDGVARVGLKRALEDTANHLEAGIHNIRDKRKQEDAAMEIARLRAKARGF